MSIFSQILSKIASGAFLFPFLIITVIGFIPCFFIIFIYSSLIKLQNQAKNSFAQIDVQLKHQHDLIPTLVKSCEDLMGHEQKTLQNVIDARNEAVSATTAAAGDPTSPNAIQNLSSAEEMLSSALGDLFTLMESYPDLKLNRSILLLQEELKSTENKVAFSKQSYNDSAMIYNMKRESLPANLISNFFQFKEIKKFSPKSKKEKDVQGISLN